MQNQGDGQQGGDRGRGRGGRGRGRGGRGRGRGRGGRGRGRQEWKPVTRLGRLVHSGTVRDLGEIYRFSLCIKEHEIVETLLRGGGEEGKLKDEVMKIMPVQKQTTAGQRTR